MSTSYTPGPWDVVEGKTLLHIETANLGDGSPCGEAICSVPKSKRGNARLIAAAPELLEALSACDKAFANWQVGQIPGRPEDILALIVKTRSAIAKSKEGQ